MTPSDYVVSCLANLMFNEPKEDSLLGFTACGLIVRNRVLSGWQGGQWLKLIASHDQYAAKIPESPRVIVFGDPHHDTLFRRCLGVAENIFNNREKDITEGALFYGRLDDCSEEFKSNIVRQMESHPMVAKIGRQMFFK